MLLISGALAIHIKHFKRRPNRPGGYYWNHRRIPKDLPPHFRSKYDDEGWIQRPLGTQDHDKVIRRHVLVHAEIEREFDIYRTADGAKVATKTT